MAVSFGASSYTAAEGGAEAAVTVTLGSAPGFGTTVEIPIETMNEGGALDADYSGVPPSVTISGTATSRTFTVMAEDDMIDDDGESVVLSFGTLPSGYTTGSQATATVTITDNDAPNVMPVFPSATATRSVEENTAVVMDLGLPLAATDADGDDLSYRLSGGATSSFQVDSMTGQLRTLAGFSYNHEAQSSYTVTVEASDGRGGTATVSVTVSVTDVEEPPGQVVPSVAKVAGMVELLRVSWPPASNTGPAVSYEVRYCRGSGAMCAADSDFTAPEAAATATGTTLTGLDAGTEYQVQVRAKNDEGEGPWSDSEAGTTEVPNRVPVFSPVTATRSVEENTAVVMDLGLPLAATDADGDNLSYRLSGGATSSFQVDSMTGQLRTLAGSSYNHEAQSSYTVTVEASDGRSGTATVSVTVSVTDVEEPPGRVVPFVAGVSGMGDRLSVSWLPAINTGPAVSYEVRYCRGSGAMCAADSDFTAPEAAATATGTTLTGLDAATEYQVQVRAKNDEGESPWSDSEAGTTGVPMLEVWFGSTLYTVAEGDTQVVSVVLLAGPERTLTIPILVTPGSTAEAADYSGVPPGVTFTSEQTVAVFTVMATDDMIDDDDESVELRLGTLPTGVRPLGDDPNVLMTTVSITDDDDPEVTVSFGETAYTVDEGASVEVTVELSAEPERAVTITITKTDLGGVSSSDYLLVPASLEFGASETAASFTVMATEDDIDDDDESVALGFGGLPAGVSASSTAGTTTVSIEDDDDPRVEVSFGETAYEVDEGGSVAVTVELSADPERDLTITLTQTQQGGATAQGVTGADYSEVPANVTFTSGQTARTFTVMATDDDIDDDGESVELGFDSPLPMRVTAPAPTATATVSLADDDDPEVTVSFEASLYSAGEGTRVAVKVVLSAEPERDLTITLTQTQQGGATAQGVTGADYSEVPASLVFGATETEKSFTVVVTQDTVDDDGESVELSFGTLPARVTEGSSPETTVVIQDDDDPEVTVSFGAVAYTAAEDGADAVVTVELSADPERDLTITITHAAEDGATAQGETGADYSGVPGSLVFGATETEKTFTVTATDDDIDDDGESVALGFDSPLPARVTEGSRPGTTVSLSDDDERGLALSSEFLEITEADGPVTETFTVSLQTRPTAAVTIEMFVESKEDFPTLPEIDPDRLTFQPSGWDEAQTVTVAVRADNDAEDEYAAVITSAVSGGDYAMLPQAAWPEVELEVRDDEEESMTVTLSTDRATVEEDAGATAVTVTATLDAGAFKEAKTVTVRLSRGADTEAEDYAAPSSLTLTIAAQADSGTATFTLTPTDDALWEPEVESLALDGSVAVLSVTGARLVLDSDDAEPRLSFTGPSEMAETGGSVELVVAITNNVGFEAAQTVNLGFTGGTATRGTDYTDDASSNRLMLGAGVVSASATVTVTAVDDDLDEDDGLPGASDDERIQVRARHGPAVGGLEELNTPLAVAILDDDDPAVAVTLSPSAGEVSEDGASSVTVVVEIDADPEREVVVELVQTRNGASASDYTTDAPGTVTFTALDHEPVTITVTAVDDAIDDDGETVELGLEAPAGDARVSVGGPSTVTILDDDERGFVWSPAALTVPEADSRGYTLALGSEPTATVTVRFTGAQALGLSVLSGGALAESATFTPGNWSEPQSLTMIALSDSDAATETVTFPHVGSGGDYAGHRAGYTVTVTDNDRVANRVLLELSAGRVSEGDGAVALTVTATLDGSAPATATTVVVEVSAGTAEAADYTASPSPLTITIPALQQQQMATLTVTAIDDAVEEGDETVTLGGTAVSGTTMLTVTPVTLTFGDNDRRGVLVSTSRLDLAEGESGTYEVTLGSAPTGTVTVTVESGHASVLASPGTLTFTATDTGPKAVTVEAVQDADATNDRVSITHAVSGADYGANNVTGPTVSVVVDDDETGSSGVLLELDPGTVSEDAGATEVTVTARLDGGALLQATTVTVTLAAGTAQASDYALDFSRLSLTIAPGELAGTMTVTLTPTADAVDENDETLSVEGTASNGFPVTGTVLTIVDDDTRGVTVTPTALALDEQDSGTYTVALDSAPTGSVTVTLSPTGADEASVRVSPGSLVFTASDHEAKTVTVSARGDRDEQGGRVTVAHAVTGADYATETAASVTVDVTDTGIVEWDVQLLVDNVSLLVEGGGARTLTVTAELLTGVQTVSVPVSVTVTGDTASASDFRASPASFTLTIPAGQAMASRPVTVTPTDDEIDEEDETLVVAPRVADHLTTNEGGVELTIADDDTRGVTVSPTVLNLAEGAGGSYTVSLGSQPSGSVTVSVTLSGSDSVTANRTSLVFTGSNWRSAQAVRVTAEQDLGPNDESVTITHAVTGGDYDREPAASVQVTVTDDDKPSEAVMLSMTPDTVAEGAGATTLTVTGMLDASARVDAMEVELSIPSGDGYTASGATLTIAAGAVSGTARLTLTPKDDAADLADLPVTVEATTSAQATLTGGITQPMRLEPDTLTVTIEDDDERGVTVTPTALTVAEDGSGEYTVVLRSEPDGSAVEVTLSLSGDDVSGATAMPSSLTFQPSDWGTAQTVTVEVPEDDGAVEADATVTIAHAVQGADYGSNNVPVATVTVMVPGYELTEEGDGVLLLVSDGAVTVPAGTPAPAGLSLGLPAHDGTTVTVRAVPAPGADPQGFRVGDTVVDIDVVELEAGATATVCLPSAEGGALSLWRWDETNLMWVELDEPPGGSPSGRVCGVTDHFSVFAVMVRLEEPELVISVEALTVTIGEEEGATYTVALGLQPAGAVTVTVTGHEGTELSVTPATLVFTEGDWNVAQAVTATVSEEAEADSEALLTHTASGGRYLGDWEKTLEVTVERDSGLLQRAREAWLARFGRTAAGHVAEAVAQRLSAPAGQETRLTLGGTQPQEALVAGVLRTLAGESKPDGRRMLADSAFVLPLSSGGEQGWTAWGRGAYTEFDGEEDGLELDGEVASGTLGVDVERGDWRLGLALSHSEGEGDIREADGDRYELESSLTGAYPYARWQLDETVSVWGVLGYGEGELEQERDGERTETDLEMRMAAFGARGALGGIENGLGTFELSLKSDLLAVRVEADADADLPEVEADAQRVRLLLEGAGHCELESGGVLAPTLEAGLRYDEGDAETGLGAELGAGLRYADGSGRLSAELSARALLAHEQSGYEEWGVGGSLRLEPDASGRGLSLHLESARGATGSGTEELWTRRDLSGLAPADDFEAAGRFRAEMGLGLNAPGGLGTLTPYVGYERTDRESAWHLGGRLKAGADLEIELEGTMRRGDGASDWQELNLYLSGRW